MINWCYPLLQHLNLIYKDFFRSEYYWIELIKNFYECFEGTDAKYHIYRLISWLISL
jgi:hypothetical protein